MDFKLYPKYYDTFALRDDLGQKAASPYWPWFLSSTAKASVRRGDPAKVYSCWNGVVAFDSAPFYADLPLRIKVSIQLVLEGGRYNRAWPHGGRQPQQAWLVAPSQANLI